MYLGKPQIPTLFIIYRKNQSKTTLRMYRCFFKNSYFSRHVFFTDTTNKSILRFSVGKANWRGSIFISETRTMYEAFKMMESFHVDKPCRIIDIYTDNSRLYSTLNKSSFTHTDMSHDASAIVKEMLEIREKLQFQIKISLVKK